MKNYVNRVIDDIRKRTKEKLKRLSSTDLFLLTLIISNVVLFILVNIIYSFI
jgi:hypothetical protein